MIASGSSLIDAIPFERCAAKTTPQGKPGTTVIEHCINVGYVARSLISHAPIQLTRLLPPNAVLAAAVHDVGKVSPSYQLKYFADLVRRFAPDVARVGPTRFGNSKHGTISAAAVDRWLAKPATPMATAAGGHHGSIERGRATDTAGIYGGETWALERRRLLEALVAEFGPSGSNAEDSTISVPVLAGLVSVADWIGSDERFFPSDAPPIYGDAAATAEHTIRECGFRAPDLRHGLTFQEIFGFPPLPSQRQFSEIVSGPGLYVLEAPMGLGKTEAALYAAYQLICAGHNRGLYFALPTRLTSDRIHERVAKFLDRISVEPASPLLAHGLAWLRDVDERGGRFAPGRKEWFGPLKRALLAPYAVGTIDQALLAVLRVRHNFVRSYGLAGKVVILDEVHSYDMYTGTLLNRLVARLLEIGCSVIVLSATLTASRRNRLSPVLADVTSQDYPLAIGVQDMKITHVSLVPPAGRVCQTRIEAWEDADVAHAAVDAASTGQCVVCIANTVARAQVWYQAIVAATNAGAFDIGLLHARFPLFQRERIEDKWVTVLGKVGPRPRGCVLIATQLVEQSVDIDADFMISELAPTDMLLQRMGRLWRHPRPERPCSSPVFVVVARDPSVAATKEDVAERLGRENCRVYAPYVLLRTHAVWHPRATVSLPEDIHPLIEATYADAAALEPPVLRELRQHLATVTDKLAALAGAAGDDVQGLPVLEDREDAATRYSDLPTAPVLLVSSLDSPSSTHAQLTLLSGETITLDEFRPDMPATRLLHHNLVTVARYLLPERVQAKGWLKPHFYDQPFVMVWNASDGSLAFDRQPTALGYRPDLGIYRIDRQLARKTSVFRDDCGDMDPFDNKRFNW
jgi:CRISPR-associated endonuclease/helicase Cas3